LVSLSEADEHDEPFSLPFSLQLRWTGVHQDQLVHRWAEDLQIIYGFSTSLSNPHTSDTDWQANASDNYIWSLQNLGMCAPWLPDPICAKGGIYLAT